MRRAAGLSAALLVMAAGGAPGGAQGLLDEEDRASSVLTARLQEVLDRRFGPGRAVAQASVRLTLSERGRAWVGRLLAAPDGGGGAPEFSWEWRDPGGRFVLPGIPAEPAAPMGGAADGAVKAPREQPPAGAALDALSRFETGVESLRVRVKLDAALPAGAEAAALDLVSEAADASPARGDSVTVVRAALPTPLERTLRDPAALASLAGSLPMLGLGLAALFGGALLALAVSRSLRRGAEALSAAVGRAIEHSAAPAPGADAPAPGADAPAVAAQGPGEIVVELGVEHVPRLAHLLREQSPENVALLMPHLKPAVRSAYLAAVSKETAAGIMLAMAPVRYVDPELLRSLKDELERRVLGVVGGPEQAAAMVRSLGEAERKAVLDALREKNPAAAADLRGRVLLFEDLGGMDEDALARVVLALGPEEAAAAAAGAGEGLREAFARALPGRAGRVFQETCDALRAAPDPARQGAAAERALKEAEALISAGRIRRPGAAGSLPGPRGPASGPAEAEAPWNS